MHFIVYLYLHLSVCLSNSLSLTHQHTVSLSPPLPPPTASGQVVDGHVQGDAASPSAGGGLQGGKHLHGVDADRAGAGLPVWNGMRCDEMR